MTTTLKTFALSTAAALAMTAAATHAQLLPSGVAVGQIGVSPFMLAPNDSYVVNVDGDALESFDIMMVVDDSDGVEFFQESITLGGGGFKDDYIRDILRTRIPQWRSDVDVVNVGDTSLIVDLKRGSRITKLELFIESTGAGPSNTTVCVIHVPAVKTFGSFSYLVNREFFVVDADGADSVSDEESDVDSGTLGDGTITLSMTAGGTHTNSTVFLPAGLADHQVLNPLAAVNTTLFAKYGPSTCFTSGWVFLKGSKHSISTTDTGMTVTGLKYSGWIN
jgi:hypothetical protein